MSAEPRTAEEAMEWWAALSDAERFAAHQDDSYGSCTICKEYVPYTDDESFAVRFPCAVVQLAESRAATLAAVREAVEGLPWEPLAPYASVDFVRDYRAAVLAILTDTDKENPSR
jgi:hypothetical protein